MSHLMVNLLVIKADKDFFNISNSFQDHHQTLVRVEMQSMDILERESMAQIH